MSSNQIAVLVAYSGAMAGELLVEAVRKQTDLRVTDHVTTTERALELLQSPDPDVALIGAALGDDPQGGFYVLRRMREIGSHVKPVMLFDTNDPGVVVEAFRAGAKGVFCLAQSGFKMLCKCVKQVHYGQIWASNKELGCIVEAFSKTPPPRILNPGGMRLLSKREEEVVRLLAEGMQNRAIARELQLSEHTIKNYLFRIFDKLGISTRVELALYAAQHWQDSLLSSTHRPQRESNISDARLASTQAANGRVTDVPELNRPFRSQPERRAARILRGTSGPA